MVSLDKAMMMYTSDIYKIPSIFKELVVPV